MIAPEWQTQWEELEGGIRHCRQCGMESIEELDCCARIANRSWLKLLIEENKPIDGEEARITFYKRVRPAFLAEKRYYELRYHEIIFRPTNSPRYLRHYWVQEANRLTAQIEQHQKLYDYFSEKREDLDAALFAGDAADARVNGKVIAEFMALARYKEFLESGLGDMLGTLNQRRNEE
ncbi:MAG: RteC domain-containing protein [Bacteroidota bacterium]|nr:RteC domain-containing protein [Bacteroidota bacterium]MDP4218556.1 RteC domain-containing protein [Bacteroidota bacterium]MDP4245987.1 RteC domain-containing protein [Bacteroidota bacterium]MDP4253834.1 RteC domain-containing protein [Bacteroidota bacterium]MDP4257760.1 RteC domain-containing protein [Bacteroidota bacterium]